MTKRDYEVGYGRPPESGKIKKGEVRNRAGRGGKKKDKDPEDFWETVCEELDREMPVSVNGKRKRTSPNRLGAKQFARRVAEGEPKAIKDLLMHLRHRGKAIRPTAGDNTFQTPAHALTMESIVRRIRSMDPTPSVSGNNCSPLFTDGAGI